MRADRGRCDAEVVVPQAGDALPPGQERRMQGQRVEVQGGVRSVRRAQGPPEARRLRPLRPCRLPGRRRRGAAGFRWLLRHLRERVRRVHGRRARWRPAGGAARRRPALRHGNHAGGGVPRQGDRHHGRRLRPVRHLPRLGRQARHPRAHLPPVQRSRQGARAAGVLRRRARLPGVQRLGPGDRRPVRRLPRRGARREDQDAERSTSPPGSTRAPASA